ncbi:putative leucine-rich repeat-containing protein DDB_G0290503 isoform X5 [Crassostrea angulata]|uniref:putative leucine-rich repeat-containing protein DDB_G0290503 isoform X5 n=1 Tax=Magallana angulata TaxID=2784310 RepID=UPI0022B139D8|nr:putative leucine-rich repeat-containing protein DDB_G0290503 isoform X5 [Crassostrea angulata]
MAAPETPRLLDSPSDIRKEIDRKLVDDGISDQCPEEEKLLYVWRLYQHTETDLQRAIENEEKLKLAQTAEMQEVENYVEHIRHLSDEREALIQELETENDQLKSEIDSLKQDQNAAALRDETTEMLVQQGLDEIANVSTSEQIAFLLVERARLLDELEAEQNRTMTPSVNSTMTETTCPQTPGLSTPGINTPGPSEDGRMSAVEFEQTLERERTQFEEELNQSRESIKKMKERLKREHEEEINALMEENNKLEDDYEEAKAKLYKHKLLHEKEMEELDKEVKKLREDLQTLQKEKEKSDSDSRSSTPANVFSGRPPSPARSPNDLAIRNIIQEKTKIESELVQIKSQHRSTQNENTELKSKVESLSEELEKLQISIQQLQMKNKSLRSELEEAENQLEEAETASEEVTKDRDEMKLRLGSLEKEVKNLRADAQKTHSLQDSVRILNQEKCDLTNELDTVKRELDEAQSEKEQLANQKLALSKEEIRLTEELQAMKSELDTYKCSHEELTDQKNELNRTLTLLDKTNSELETLRSEKFELNCRSENLSKENKDLLNQVESLQGELERLRSDGQEMSKQQIIINHMRDQVQKLTKEISDLKNSLQEKEKAEKDLNKTIEVQEAEISRLKSDIDNLKHVHEKERVDIQEEHANEIEDLKMKLQLTLQELSRSKQMLDDERSQCSEVEVKAHDLEVLLEEMQKTNSAYEKKLDEVSHLEKRVKDLEKLVSEKCDIEDQLEDKNREISDLEQEIEEFESIKLELEDTRESLDKEKVIRSKLEATVRDLEQILDDQRTDHESIQQQFTNKQDIGILIKEKVQSLESQVRGLQDDLFAAQEELQVTMEKHEQMFLYRMLRINLREYILDRIGKELEEARAAHIEIQERIESEKQRQTLQSSPEVNGATQRIEVQKVENLEKQIETMKTRLTETQNQLDKATQEKSTSEKEIKILRDSLKQKEGDMKEIEALRQELSQARREVEHLQLSTKYDGEERQKHVDRIRSLEELSKQLELDNRELATKLQESIQQISHVEDQIKRERQRNTDKQYMNHRHVSQIEADLDEATSQVRQLKDDLQKKQTYIMKLEADAIGNAAKYESTISRLESELNETKQFHKKELEAVTERLETTCKDNKELRNQIREKDQEYQSSFQDVNRYRGTADRLESQIQTEIKIRTDLENRNAALDKEISKAQTERNVWSQVRSLMEKNASLEAAKRSLEDELERKNSSSKFAETTLSQASANHEAVLKSVQSKADSAEKKVVWSGHKSPVQRRETKAKPFILKAEKLQHDLETVTFKLKTVEQQLSQAEELKNELQDKKEKVAALRNQLEAEKLQRTLLDQTVSELKHQVSLLKSRESKVIDQNRELQHTMIDMETKLDDMQERNQTALDMDALTWDEEENNEQKRYTEVGKRGLLDQIHKLQKEVKDLQYELLTVNERREIQERKYEDRKMKTKVKLMRARTFNAGCVEEGQEFVVEFYSKERTRMQEQLRQYDDDLRLTRSTLRKEMDWKEKMEKNYQTVLREKREYLSQLSDMEEAVREKTRMVSMLQVRTKFLEEENSRLQDRIDSITKQKQGLDKLLKEYKLSGKDVHLSRLSSDSRPHSLTGGTSGIGNSVDSSWVNEQDPYIEPYLGYRNTQSSNMVINNYLSRSFEPHSHAVDLYRGETGSEESYSREFDT